MSFYPPKMRYYGQKNYTTCTMHAVSLSNLMDFSFQPYFSAVVLSQFLLLLAMDAANNAYLRIGTGSEKTKDAAMAPTLLLC
jgi:hypothetical protein